MKFRIFVSALVVIVLGALAVAFQESSQPTQSVPAQSADDKAFKGLSINN